MEHLLLVQFVTPRRHQKRPVAVDFFLCAISSANVVQKRVKSEFRGIRPLTTNNLLRVHHCLLLVPGTWYLVPGTAAAAAAAAGLADRGRTVLPTGTQPVFGYQVPGTR